MNYTVFNHLQSIVNISHNIKINNCLINGFQGIPLLGVYSKITINLL